MRLVSGLTNGPENGGCIMAVISWYAGEEWTDAPSCVCPVLRHLAIAINDHWTLAHVDPRRDRLLGPLLFRLMGTTGTPPWRRLRFLLRQMDLRVDHRLRLRLRARAAANLHTKPRGYSSRLEAAASTAAGLTARHFNLQGMRRLLREACEIGERQEVPQVRRLEDLPV